MSVEDILDKLCNSFEELKANISEVTECVSATEREIQTIRELEGPPFNHQGLNQFAELYQARNQSGQANPSPRQQQAASWGPEDTAPRIFELQEAYTSIKDKHCSVSLPPDLLFHTLRKT